MAPDAALTTIVDQLIDLFNRQSLDLPDGLFTRHTQFRLNGVPLKTSSVDRRAIRSCSMLTRGPAGYRFAAKAVQHAVSDARLQRGELSESISDTGLVISGQCWLSGTFRGTHEPADVLVTVALTVSGATLTHADASIDPHALERLREARLRP